MTITSRTEGLPCAYQAKYDGCKMINVKSSAGNQGTCITAEDMFYDAPSRRQSLKPHEEASKVEDIITRYAVHRPSVFVVHVALLLRFSEIFHLLFVVPAPYFEQRATAIGRQLLVH